MHILGQEHTVLISLFLIHAFFIRPLPISLLEERVTGFPVREESLQTNHVHPDRRLPSKTSRWATAGLSQIEKMCRVQSILPLSCSCIQESISSPAEEIHGFSFAHKLCLAKLSSDLKDLKSAEYKFSLRDGLEKSILAPFRNIHMIMDCYPWQETVRNRHIHKNALWSAFRLGVVHGHSAKIHRT